MYYEIKRWWTAYAGGGEDQRSLHTFMDCEPTDRTAQLRLELGGIAQGNGNEELLAKVIGGSRKSKHGSFQEWARLCLLWMASHKG